MEEQKTHQPVPSPVSVKQAIERARALREEEENAAGSQAEEIQSRKIPTGKPEATKLSEPEST